jgi:hypothetical protein
LDWEELKNGELLDAAEKEGLEVMVTCERNLRYQQNFSGRSIAIVVLPSGRWPAVRDQIEEVVTAIDEATPGSYREVPFRRMPKPAL